MQSSSNLYQSLITDFQEAEMNMNCVNVDCNKKNRGVSIDYNQKGNVEREVIIGKFPL